MLNEIKTLMPDDMIALEVIVENKYRQIKVVVDGKKPVGLKDTALLAKIIRESGLLEKDKYLDYQLEVTTPGIGSPLLFAFQFEKNIGRKIRVLGKDSDKQIDLRLTQAGKKSFKGLNDKGRSVRFDYNNIQTAKVLVEFI